MHLKNLIKMLFPIIWKIPIILCMVTVFSRAEGAIISDNLSSKELEIASF